MDGEGEGYSVSGILPSLKFGIGSVLDAKAFSDSVRVAVGIRKLVGSLKKECCRDKAMPCLRGFQHILRKKMFCVSKSSVFGVRHPEAQIA